MAQPGNFTPILLYSSSTSTNVPLAANLTNSTNGAELAINIADKNLFFKDSGGTVNTVPIRQSSTSSNGWLSATDWNTFNNKAPATSGTSILYGNGLGGFSNVTIGSGITFAGGTLSATGSGGTVTSVTGTAPVVSSGGTTPAISMPAATTSVNGYLTSTDWNTFNSKQPAGTYVTSVAATSPVTSSGGTTPTIAMPAAATSVSGYLTSTDWNTFNNKQAAGSYLTAISVVSANGFAGTSSGGTTPALTLSTSITGLLKGNGTAISAATSGTDYAPATSGSSILYGNGVGGFSNVTIGTGLTFIGGTLASTASGGTVTSVAASVPAFLSISGSPITTSGTLAISYSGTALPVANGGTGQTSFTAGYVHFGSFSTDSNFFWDNTNKRLGVGGATPQAPLHVNAANNTTSLFLTPNSGGTAGDYTQLGFGNSAGSATVYGGIRTAFLSPAGTAAVSMQFFTHDGTSYAQRMQIGPNGGVSIGNTTDPGATNLSVTGVIKIGANQAVNGPAFSAYQNASVSVANGTFTKLPINTETFDTASAFDSTTNYRFTPLIAGYYQVNGCMNYMAGTGGGNVFVSIYKNGSEYRRGAAQTATGGLSSNVSDVVYLNGSTDYIELYVYQASGLTQTYNPGALLTYFSSAMLRGA